MRSDAPEEGDEGWTFIGAGMVIIGVTGAVIGAVAGGAGGLAVVGLGGLIVVGGLYILYQEEAFDGFMERGPLGPLDKALKGGASLGGGLGSFLACVGACEQGFQPIRPGTPDPTTSDGGTGPAV